MRLDANDIPEVAVAAMHVVHLEEVAIINGICEMLEKIGQGDASEEGLTGMLDDLLDHARDHFAREEALMKLYDFPPYPVHKAAHDEFLGMMERMVRDWKSGGSINAVVRFMQHDLPTWIVGHISTMDLVTARFVAMQSEKT